MSITANGKEIPGVESLYHDFMYQGDSKRDTLHLLFREVPTQAAVKALLAGDIQVGEHSHKGYNAIHGCELVLVRSGDENQTLAELQETQEALAATKETLEAAQEAQALLVRAFSPRMTDTEALALAHAPWPAWQPGTAYLAGEIVAHGGALYRVVQGITSQAHQEPGGEGLLAVYRPVQAEPEEGEVLPWVNGEEVAQGERRAYNGVVYECIGAGANVWTPDTAPALWKVVV